MTTEREADDIENSRQESGANAAPLPKRDDDILLDRLKHEPPLKPQAPLSLTLGIVAGALALGTVLYFAFRKPETYLQDTPPLAQQHHNDSSALSGKRSHLAPIIDSLETAMRNGHDDVQAALALANLYYDGEYWDRALAAYEHYLDHAPDNVDARIDYAFAITQVSGDFKLAISEIEKGLAVNPEHVQGLFNAGILSLRANINDKAAALSSARAYFDRAKKAAAKQGNTQMSGQIDEILKEMERVEKEPTSSP